MQRRDVDYVGLLIDFVRRHKGVIYHATDEANFQSIAEHGLLSKQEAEKLGVEPAFSGGNELTRQLDREKGLRGKIFLGFGTSSLMPDHRDERHLRRPAVLNIDPCVLSRPGVAIAFSCAHHYHTKIYAAWRAVPQMGEEALELSLTAEFDRGDPQLLSRVKQAARYEILVPTRIPSEDIVGWE